MFTVLLTVSLLAIFWLGSRYPQLNEKASMGANVSMSGLAFDILLEVPPDAGLLASAASNTVNWIYTNWKGMAFGVLFGACLLTGMGLVQYRSFNNSFADAALGATIGAPLGVCVNCAAPIAQGLHSAGSRLETTLAALVASPTLNVIVVSMSFALLPTYMATIKLLAMLGFILIGIPLLSRFVFANERSAPVSLATQSVPSAPGFMSRFAERFKTAPTDWVASEGNTAAVVWVLRAFATNLWFLIRVTVPLMVVAGALGSIAVSILPVSSLLDFLETFQGPAMIVGAMLAVTAFALFLPVPIAFDVILASVLVTAGVPAKYVLPVLLGLGSFSIYSFLIIGRAISYKVSIVMALALGLVAFASGAFGSKLEKKLLFNSLTAEINILKTVTPPTTRIYQPTDLATLPTPRDSIETATFITEDFDGVMRHDGAGSVSAAITRLPESTPGDSPSDSFSTTAFSKIDGRDIGLDHGDLRSDLEAFEPYVYFWAIAAGDIHGDGWDDVVMANNAMQGGVSLYANRGGRFVRQTLDLGPVQTSFVNATALVDLNNDGWLDLFVATYFNGSHVFWNQQGQFDAARHAALPNGDAPMMGAPGFADLDGDGWLDIVAANWSVGTMTSLRNPHLASSRDRILWNDAGSFSTQELDGVPGESLTSLITDVDGDGDPDILIGDDIAKSDKVYLNEGNRRFKLLDRSAGLIPWLTFSTMSFDSGDFNNDLRQDLYSAQIARPQNRSDRGKLDLRRDICEQQSSDPAGLENCFSRERERVMAGVKPVARIQRCDHIAHPPYRASCAALGVIAAAVGNGDPALCARIPESWPQALEICKLSNGERVAQANDTMAELGYLGGHESRNVLLEKGIDQRYADTTVANDVGLPGWSWNSKFADLNQDGWQDLYVATAEHYGSRYGPNMLYQNNQGKDFTDGTEAMGLSDLIPTTAYVLLDFDRDGDIDMIRAPGMAEPIVHRNVQPVGKAVWINLRDQVGNSYGIGALIDIQTSSATAPRQLRQVKASGGFVSFDPPKVHFGLGDAQTIEQIRVTWADGAVTVLEGPIAANSEIVVQRQ